METVSRMIISGSAASGNAHSAKVAELAAGQGAASVVISSVCGHITQILMYESVDNLHKANTHKHTLTKL